MTAPTIAELLDFEAEHERHTYAKESAIADTFDFPAARYYQLLRRAIHTSDGVAHNPLLCGRIRARLDRAHRRHAAHAEGARQ